jgi:hypothetical protein
VLTDHPVARNAAERFYARLIGHPPPGDLRMRPGPDLASDPLSQVPDEAAGLVRALLTADRNQRFALTRSIASPSTVGRAHPAAASPLLDGANAREQLDGRLGQGHLAALDGLPQLMSVLKAVGVHQAALLLTRCPGCPPWAPFASRRSQRMANPVSISDGIHAWRERLLPALGASAAAVGAMTNTAHGRLR